VLIAGNGDSIFKRLMDTIGRNDLGTSSDLANNAGRVERVAELDAATPERTERIIYTSDNRQSVPVSILQTSAAAIELQSRFGPSSGRDALYRIGPHAELVGLRIDDLRRTGDPPVEIALLRDGTTYSSDSKTLVPCYFEARLVSAQNGETPVNFAVAVNGTIRAVTRTYQLDSLRDRWSAMVPEEAFHDGENDVQFFVVSGAAPDLRLTPCVAKAPVR
jgi:hypothetical protein